LWESLSARGLTFVVKNLSSANKGHSIEAMDMCLDRRSQEYQWKAISQKTSLGHLGFPVGELAWYLGRRNAMFAKAT